MQGTPALRKDAAVTKAALPPTPAGWTLKDPGAKMALAAPKDECKGGDPVPGWYGAYT